MPAAKRKPAVKKRATPNPPVEPHQKATYNKLIRRGMSEAQATAFSKNIRKPSEKVATTPKDTGRKPASRKVTSRSSKPVSKAGNRKSRGSR